MTTEPSSVYRNSLTYLLQTMLASGDADDAIADLDAFQEALLAEAADRVAGLGTANDGQMIHATREQILNAIRNA